MQKSASFSAHIQTLFLKFVVCCCRVVAIESSAIYTANSKFSTTVFISEGMGGTVIHFDGGGGGGGIDEVGSNGGSGCVEGVGGSGGGVRILSSSSIIGILLTKYVNMISISKCNVDIYCCGYCRLFLLYCC